MEVKPQTEKKLCCDCADFYVESVLFPKGALFFSKQHKQRLNFPLSMSLVISGNMEDCSDWRDPWKG